MNVRHPIGVLQRFLTFILYQKYFYDKMNLRLFYFHVTKGVLRPFSIENVFYDKTDLGLLFSCDEVWAEMEQ